MKTSTTSTRRRGARSAKSSLALAVVAALFGGGALCASAAPTSSLATVAHPTLLSRGDAIMGALPASQPMHVVVALKLRNKDALDAFVANAMKQRAKGAAITPMSSAQILANHAPTQQQAQTVASYLTNMGFTNVRIAENRMLVTADGTAATAANAFLTSFKQVHTHGGRVAFANSDDVRIPAALSDKIQSVLGLQNVHQLHTFATTPKALPAQAQKAAATRTAGSVHPEYTNYYFPEEFSTVYAANSAAPSSDIIVGIISEGDVTTTINDLNSYTDGIGFARVTTNILSTTGIIPASSDTSGQVEWNLDSQDIVGTAGGHLKQLNFYTMPDMTNGSVVANFNKAVTANKAKIINVSLGECETGAQGGNGADAADAILEIGVAQGQTFSISTGDHGADECANGGITPSWPANSQYVVAVAGTNLIAGTPGRSNPKAWSSETEWTDSGGSESTYEPKPSWQTAWGGTFRGVADVAFDADPNTGAAIYLGPPAVAAGNAGYYLVGGTSLAAPIFSGLWSRVLEQHPTIGFAGPIIYDLNSTDFHDITSGSNGIPAAVGYDLASGRGSVIFSNAIADINTNNLGNQPPVAAFSDVINGLSVNFTDTSTDADGNIASHYWLFGDGASSADANPTHVYAAAGTYSVKEKVTDSVGAFTSKVNNVKVAPYQLIANPGFENGLPGHWTMTAGALQNNSSLAHSGNWFASLGGGSGAHTDHVMQGVTIPAGVPSATLSFYVNAFTADTGTIAHDTLKVQVIASGTTTTLATYSNLDATSGYVQYNIDMSAYIGQAVTVKFTGYNNATLPTTWYLDDVTLIAP